MNISAEEKARYLSKKVFPLMDAISLAILTEQPEDPEAFLLKYLMERAGVKGSYPVPYPTRQGGTNDALQQTSSLSVKQAEAASGGAVHGGASLFSTGIGVEQESEAQDEGFERVGWEKAEQKDFDGALAAYYKALQVRELNDSLENTGGASVFFELARLRLQLGDKKAALLDFERCREILSKVQLREITKGRDVLTAIEEVKASIRHDAASMIGKIAQGRLCRRRAAKVKEATQTPPPLPLPPLKKAQLLAQHIAADKVPVFLTGSNTHEHFTKRQKMLFEEVFRALSDSVVLQDHALMIGTSAHGRAPPGRFATWPFRGAVFDNIAQEEAFRAMGNERTIMLTFEEQAGDWDIEGPVWKTIKLGPKDGVISKSADVVEEVEALVMKVCTPDTSALPGAEPQQWQGVKGLPRVYVVLGGGPRASQYVIERDNEAECTQEVPHPKALLTPDTYPYKPESLFVFAAGGLPAAQIMASGPELFKPPPVPEELWQKLSDKEVVAFCADMSEADLGESDRLVVINYANNVAKALEFIVQDADQQRPRGNAGHTMHAMLAQANKQRQAERDRQDLECVGQEKAELKDFTGAFSAYYKALQTRELNNSVESTGGASLFFELAGLRLQLGDKKAALLDYERCREIRAKIKLLESSEGREVLAAIRELQASIKKDAALMIGRVAQGRLSRKKVADMKEASQAPPPLPLPPLEKAKVLMQHIAGDKVPVLLTSPKTLEHLSKRQRLLFKEVFRALSDSSVLQNGALMIGASAHGRSPSGRFVAMWPLRGRVFDCIAQEEAYRAMGREQAMMLTFGEQAGEWDIEGPTRKSIKLGPSDGVIQNSADIVEEVEGLVVKIKTPDIEALPSAEPQQWQGIKSLPPVALVFGADPRASQLATERDEDSGCTKEMIDVKAALTPSSYPYKPGALFVLAAGGQPAAQIMASGPELFKPPPVPEELWQKLSDKEVVAFFADKSEADLDARSQQLVVDYADSVASALVCLVQDAAQQRHSWTAPQAVPAGFHAVEEKAGAAVEVAKAPGETDTAQEAQVDPWSYTWDTSGKAQTIQSMSSTDHMDSPEFPLRGIDGFTMRYWPHWDPAQGLACMRLCGPRVVQSKFRLGVGQTLDLCKEVELNETDTGGYMSESWFFTAPSADTDDYHMLWVESLADE